MFSKQKQFFNKNILLIGIVLFAILIVLYFVFMYNSKEGFDTPDPVKLIPVSTINKMYVELGNTPEVKELLDPIVEMLRLITENYAQAYKANILVENTHEQSKNDSRNIFNQPWDVVREKICAPSEANDSFEVRLKEVEIIEQKANAIIKPAMLKILPVVYKILALQKIIMSQLQNKFGWMFSREKEKQHKYIIAFINASYADNTLSLILGPDYVTPLPSLPILSNNNLTDDEINLINSTSSALSEYEQRLLQPFMMLNFTESRYGICKDLVLQLTDNLNVALANDATGQATITDYKNQIAELKFQQNLAGQSKTAPETVTIDSKLTKFDTAKKAAAQKHKRQQ
jgi:hypothetical protein